MRCNNCGAENTNTKFCTYCGTELKGAQILAVQILKHYYLTARGFMVNGIAKTTLKPNDIVKNNRTQKSFTILYIVNNKFKIIKVAEPENECTICLSEANLSDFEPGDELVF